MDTAGFALLLLCQSAGEVLARAANLPLARPGARAAAALGAAQLAALRAPVAAAAEPLLRHLSLLFVPVGVGVITHLALIGQYGGRMLVAIVLSTWIGMAVAALVLRALLPRRNRLARPPERACRASSNSGSTSRPRRCSG